jgi:predicted acylesterase/phospholipase RssA
LPQRQSTARPSGNSTLELDKRNDVFLRDLLDSIEHGSGPYHVLALSAGGQWGAYGAGVLAGLAAANNVPAFSLVTGISIGAMLAPLLFMGEYTEARNFYTNLTDSDIYRMRSVGELLIANSLVDTAPLRAKVAAIITQDFVDRLARENAERHRVHHRRRVPVRRRHLGHLRSHRHRDR